MSKIERIPARRAESELVPRPPGESGPIGRCPRCEQPTLASIAVGDAPAARCLRCSGYWIPRASAGALRAAFPHVGELDRTRLAEIRRAAAERNLHDGVRYLRCPICDTRMDRRQFAAGSGIVIDRCLGHGVWFDGGELELAAEYFRVGGPDDAAHREPAEKRPAMPATTAAKLHSQEAEWITQLFIWLST